MITSLVWTFWTKNFNSSLKNEYFGAIIFQEIEFFEHLKCNLKLHDDQIWINIFSILTRQPHKVKLTEKKNLFPKLWVVLSVTHLRSESWRKFLILLVKKQLSIEIKPIFQFEVFVLLRRWKWLTFKTLIFENFWGPPLIQFPKLPLSTLILRQKTF